MIFKKNFMLPHTHQFSNLWCLHFLKIRNCYPRVDVINYNKSWSFVLRVFAENRMFDSEHVERSMSTESESDEDASENSDLNDLFTKQYEVQAETSISDNHTYILHMCGGTKLTSKIAVGLSDSSCAVYDVNTITKVVSASCHQKALSGLRFSPMSDHLLYSCSMDGTVKLWDLRTDMKNSKTEFIDDTSDSNVFKPLTTFDVSADNRFVCAGSQLVDGDVYLLFWDARSAKLLGGYWETHSDDITQVHFHPSEQNTMATGSTDGLINIFDVSQSCEDDALQYCLNTESSVSKIIWLGNGDSLSCITHTEDLQLWKTDGEAPEIQFSRENITKCLQNKPGSCYIIDLHKKNASGQIMLLVGSQSKNSQLTSLEVSSEKIKPMCQFLNNRQIVRASWYLEDGERLITGGEAGLLNVWKPVEVLNGQENGRSPLSPKSSNFKVQSKFKQRTEFPKPY